MLSSLCLCQQQTFWLTDMAVDMNDKILMMMESEARKSASAFHEKMLSGYNTLRMYVPFMLRQISFRAAGSSSNDLISAR